MAGDWINLYGVIAMLPIAVGLDLTFGDPHGWPHPVRLMGRLIEWSEPLFRKWHSNLIMGGAVFAVGLIAVTYITTISLVRLAYGWHPIAGISIEIILIYYAVSIRSLNIAAMAVQSALITDRLDRARGRLSHIVGRDTRDLDNPSIVRAAIETVAENLVDGVISPLFYAAIGGAPLAMAYKMINTLDSMVGYKNEAYRHFGKAAARIDDAANFIPARISVVLITISAQLTLRNGRMALLTALREGRHHTSPNAGWPEAAFAGALKIRLGGPSYYHGKRVPKPFLGKNYGDVKPNDISKACRLMLMTAYIWVALLTFAQGFWAFL